MERNAAKTITLNTKFARTPFAHRCVTFITIALRDPTQSPNHFRKAEVYQMDPETGIEMFLGYAIDLGDLGSSAHIALFEGIFANGMDPMIEGVLAGRSAAAAA